jgi:cellulose synthase/poly-beta-1,6-N-acetylglucosamine synthase-like glycosyltransferase
VHLVCAAIEIALYAMLLAASAHLLRQAAWGFAAGRMKVRAPTPRTSRTVTVQLPLRNEPEMAEGVVRAAAALEGADIELQLLDDSDDETSALLDRLGAELRAAGHDVPVVRRPDRRGYKAGNLAFGLARARGELVLVLDADFRPTPDLISQLAAVLAADPSLAFAQARWTFRNEHSLVTRLQAAILDSLFVVEQARLTASGSPVQFNGTAGLWRRDAIERAGGWATSDDALTEDLDLSLRAHEAGLRGATCPELTVSTELPADMRTFRVQQARWVRGGALTLRALGARLFRRGGLRDALTIASHLVRHARQPLLVAALLRLPIVAWTGITPLVPSWMSVTIVTLAIASSGLYLAAGARRIGHSTVRRFVEALPLAVLSLGLAAPLSVAFVGGLLGRRGGGFQRTA